MSYMALMVRGGVGAHGGRGGIGAGTDLTYGQAVWHTFIRPTNILNGHPWCPI